MASFSKLAMSLKNKKEKTPKRKESRTSDLNSAPPTKVRRRNSSEENDDELNDSLMNMMLQLLLKLSSDVSIIKKMMIKTNTSLANLEEIIESDSEPEIIEEDEEIINLPCDTIEIFRKFDNKLIEENFLKKIADKIYLLIDLRQTFDSNVSIIIKAFMTYNVAIHFVTDEGVYRELIFKDTKLHQVLEGTFVTVFKKVSPDVTLDKFEKVVQDTLNIAKNFNTPKCNRQKKINQEDDNQNEIIQVD